MATTQREEERQRPPFLSLLRSLNFHRDQCYFISAIEMAALLLDNEANNSLQSNAVTPDVVGIMLSIPLSMNGFVPIIFTLTCISRHARLSWYLIILSVITLILSTGSSASTHAYLLNNYPYLPGDQIEVMVEGLSDLDQANLICGSEASNLDSVDPPRISFSSICIGLLYRLWTVVHR